MIETDSFHAGSVLSKRKHALGTAASPASCFSNKLSTKDNLKLRWTERITSSHLPSANFIFEVTFVDVDSMRFEAIARSIHYSEDTDDFMECYAVNDVMPFFSNVIYPGDILLRVNGQSLLRKSVNGEFIDPQKSSSCFENIATAAVASSNAVPTSGVTIRFMRTGSTSMNFTPSPAELNLFQVDKHIAAKFNVIKVQPAKPVSAVPKPPSDPAPQAQQQQWSIQLSFLDQQLPASIGQMMLGGAVTWGHSLLLQSSHAAALAQCTQTGLLASTPGTASSAAGPGAFLGPNGAPSTLADSWISPSVPLYTSAAPTSDPLAVGTVAERKGTSPGMGIERTVAHAVGALIAGMATTAPISVHGANTLAQTHVVATDEGTGSAPADSSTGSVLSVGATVYALDATTSSSSSGSLLGGLGVTGLGGGLAGASGGGSGLLAAQMLGAGAGAGGGAAGALKALPRWSASLRVTLAGADGSGGAPLRELQYSLGRFDKEADARLACQQAILEVQENQQFCAKRFAKRFGTAYAASVAAAATQAQQQRQQQGTYPQSGGVAGVGANKGAGPPHTSSTGAPLSKYMMNTHGAGGGFRPGVAGSASAGSMLNPALNAKVTCTGEPTCGFGSVAKVVVNLAVSGVHGSGSSGNIAGLNSQMHRTK